MKNFKITISILLLLVLAFSGFGCTKSPKSFYKKLCKTAVPFQEKVRDYYEYGDSYSDLGYYDDVDECIEKSLETEEELYEGCLEEKDDDKKKCQGLIDDYRETIAEILTKEGCEKMYGGFGCVAYKVTSDTKKYLSAQEIADMEDKYDECMEDIVELCEDLPKEF